MKRPKIEPKKAKNTTYQIDQSGRIEYTSHDTVLAIANGSTYSVLLRANEKRLLHSIFRIYFNKNRQYVYEVFSALVYILLTHMKAKSQVLIDKEYPGKEDLIKLHILEYDVDKILLAENIGFGLVGKKSPAHHLAYAVFKKYQNPSKIVHSQDLIKIIFASKKTGYSAINGTEGS